VNTSAGFRNLGCGIGQFVELEIHYLSGFQQIAACRKMNFRSANSLNFGVAGMAIR